MLLKSASFVIYVQTSGLSAGYPKYLISSGSREQVCSKCSAFVYYRQIYLPSPIVLTFIQG